MNVAAEQFGVMNCLGGCGPNLAYETGLAPFLVFAMVAFIVGYRLSRANLLLPVVCMITIATSFYALFWMKTKPIAQSLHKYPNLISQMQAEFLKEYGLFYLIFVAIPFALGLIFNVVGRAKGLRAASVPGLDQL